MNENIDSMQFIILIGNKNANIVLFKFGWKYLFTMKNKTIVRKLLNDFLWKMLCTLEANANVIHI